MAIVGVTAPGLRPTAQLAMIAAIDTSGKRRTEVIVQNNARWLSVGRG